MGRRNWEFTFYWKLWDETLFLASLCKTFLAKVYDQISIRLQSEHWYTAYLFMIPCLKLMVTIIARRFLALQNGDILGLVNYQFFLYLLLDVTVYSPGD